VGIDFKEDPRTGERIERRNIFPKLWQCKSISETAKVELPSMLKCRIKDYSCGEEIKQNIYL